MKRCLACEQAFESDEWQCPRCGGSPGSLGGYVAFAPALAAAKDGFAPEFFSQLATLEKGNFWFESRNSLLIWALRRYFSDAESFLEVGCGTGFVLSAVQGRFPHMRLAGGEMFVQALLHATKRLPDAALFQMDARNMPFESEFSVIGAFDVLEHIDEDETVLREIHRALQPGGGVILTVPQHPFLWSVADDHAFHKRRYTRAELLGKVTGAGFKVVRVTSFVSTLMPLMLLSRLARKCHIRRFDPYGELGLGANVNRILRNILEGEQFFISHGVSFPVGGSLLVIARRDSAR